MRLHANPTGAIHALDSRSDRRDGLRLGWDSPATSKWWSFSVIIASKPTMLIAGIYNQQHYQEVNGGAFAMAAHQPHQVVQLPVKWSVLNRWTY